MKNSFNGDGQGKAFIVIWKLSCCSNAVWDKSEGQNCSMQPVQNGKLSFKKDNAVTSRL